MKLQRFLPFLMAATLVPFCLSVEAAAAPATIAVLPVAVVNGDQDNGPPVSAAIEAVLREAGHRLSDSDSVARVLGATRENLATPRTLIQLTRMGRKLGANYVIYTRLLTVGRPFSATRDSDRSAVMLVNIVDVASGRIKQTYQSAGDFTDLDQLRQSMVPDAAAQSIVHRLLEPFLEMLR